VGFAIYALQKLIQQEFSVLRNYGANNAVIVSVVR